MTTDKMTPSQKRDKLDSLKQAKAHSIAIMQHYTRYLNEIDDIVGPLIEKRDKLNQEIAEAYEKHEKAPKAIQACQAKINKCDQDYKRIEVDPKVQRLLKLREELKKLEGEVTEEQIAALDEQE